MKKLSAVVLAAVVVMGITAMAYAQSGNDVIDNIRIMAIKKIAITDGNIMDVTITFRNANSNEIKFANGKQFVFSVGSKIGDVDADALKAIGEESFEGQEKGPLCKNARKDCETDVVFHIKMGDNAQTSDALKHLLNCIGDPTYKQPYFTIQGTFELGIISPKGTTWAKDLGIDWKFIPRIQKNVGFMQGDNSPQKK
jgi:hypothetical protein